MPGEAQLYVACFPALAVLQLDVFDALTACHAQQVSALRSEACIVMQKGGESVAPIRLPGAALAGLQTILVIHLEQRAGLNKPFEQLGDVHPQLGATGFEILHEQVSQRLRGSSQADVGPILLRQLADQENQGAEPRPQIPFRGAVPLLLEQLMDLAE